MPRLATKNFPQELPDYYDYYAHGKVSKREFLNLVTKYAVDRMTALALSDLLKLNRALATQIELTDPETVAEYITYPSPSGHGEVQSYLVGPAEMSGKIPAVVMVHENRGLGPYVGDITRRVVKVGYIALAPGGLSSIGGYPGNDDKGHELRQQVNPTKLMNNFFAAIKFMRHYPQAIGKVGISGFCYGEGVSNTAAIAYPELTCTIPFYGRQVPTADMTKIGAPLLLRYIELGSRINEGWPAHEAVLKVSSKAYEACIYPGVNHGFHNNPTPRYDKSTASLVWQRTLKWFDKYFS